MRKINLHSDVLLRNRFTSKSSRQYFSIIKFRGIEQTRHQTPRARRSTTNVTTFAAPLEKSRGTPGRRGTQFGNRWSTEFALVAETNQIAKSDDLQPSIRG